MRPDAIDLAALNEQCYQFTSSLFKNTWQALYATTDTYMLYLENMSTSLTL